MAKAWGDAGLMAAGTNVEVLEAGVDESGNPIEEDA